MIVVFDTSVLVYFLDENANAPIDAVTGAPVTECKARLDHLILSLQQGKAKIIIPTPTLGELLVKAQQAAPDWLDIFHKSRQFRIVGFDERAAIEFAATQAARAASGKMNEVPRAKAKFDDQIVAIAAVESATIIYSDDPHIKALARGRFTVIGVADLPLPPSDAQMDFFKQKDADPPSADDEGGE